jgi:type VI secretion system protein ImpB
MAESTQHKLDRVRPPRVQITYDVEIGGAMQKRELPFVFGVLADLSGKPEQPLPRLKDRGFVEIDRDNFNEVLASATPRLAFSVENKLTEQGGFINTELKFRSIDDFEPLNVMLQIEPLRKLYEARCRLADLTAKLDGNDNLDAKLQEISASTDALTEIKKVDAKAGSEESPKTEESNG